MNYKPAHIALMLILLSSYTSALAQDNWDAYKPRTLNQIIKQHSDPRTLSRVNTLFSGDDFPSRVKVIYTGESRAISAERKAHIQAWVKVRGMNDEIADLFETELLFKEDGVEYWLPIQKQVIPYFAQELKKGDQVTLFLIWIGGYKSAGRWDWVFLVNEFEA